MPISLKIGQLESAAGQEVDADVIGREIAERMAMLARAGEDIDRVVERAYRILER
jgi:hypothetical protein